jgi:hypothetical protein
MKIQQAENIKKILRAYSFKSIPSNTFFNLHIALYQAITTDILCQIFVILPQMIFRETSISAPGTLSVM